MGKTQAEKTKKKIIKYFRNMIQNGVLLYMEDHVCGPGELSNLVCESGGYMADYVIDDGGRLREVRFDRVFEQ